MIGVWPESQVPAELRAQVIALHRQAWPDLSGTGHDPALHPVSMLLLDEERVVAALDILSKEISHAGELYQASGLSTVVTELSQQRKGNGSLLVREAHRHIQASGADLGIFTCDTPLRRFYERNGWEVIPGAVLVGGTPEDPFPSDRFDKVVLADFFTAHAREKRASFAGARISLYPGQIDKLW